MEAKLLDSMPDEVLIHILLYLEASQLKKVATMNFRFANLIATCSPLCSKFTLKIEPQMSNQTVDFLINENTRGMGILCFSGFLPEVTTRMTRIVERILEKYGSGINKLIFGQNEEARNRQFFTLQYCHKILIAVQSKVKEIFFGKCEFANLYEENTDDWEKIHLKCLRKITALQKTSIGCLFSFIAPITSLRHLELGYSPDFTEIYNPQQDLSVLISHDQEFGLASVILPDVTENLKLKKFVCSTRFINDFYKENFQIFLERQQLLEELQTPTIDEFWPSILQMQHLRSLSTDLSEHTSTESLLTSSSIQILSVDVSKTVNPTSFESFMMRFPKIRILKIQLFREFESDSTLFTFSKLSNLESVSITMLEICEVMSFMKSDKLKEVHIKYGETSLNIWNTFLDRCPNIKVLEMYDCNVNIDIMSSICTNLKDLEELAVNPGIENPVLNQLSDSRILKIILKNCGKLKKLSMFLYGEEKKYKPLLRRFKSKLTNMTCELNYSEIDFLATGEDDVFNVSDESYDEKSSGTSDEEPEPINKVSKLSSDVY